MPRSSKNNFNFSSLIYRPVTPIFLDMPREQLRPEILFESLMLLTEKIEALKQKEKFCKKRTNKQTQIGRINDK